MASGYDRYFALRACTLISRASSISSLRHAHILHGKTSLPFFIFYQRKERNNICFVNYALMILFIFSSFLLSFSRFICLSTPAMINRNIASCPARVLSLLCCFRGNAATPTREKRLSFHGNAVTLWHLSTLRAVIGV